MSASLVGSEMCIRDSAYPLQTTTRIPGGANVRAGALSHLFVPEPKVIPSVLRHAARARPPPRGAGFFLAARRAPQ
eukprot:1839136-Alexandrium_andersonii.AAC.1